MRAFRRCLIHPVIAVCLLATAAAQEPGPRVDFIHDTVEVEGVAVGPARFKDNPPAAFLSAREAAKVLADAQLGSLLAGLYVDVSFDQSGARRIREELPRTHIPGGMIVAQSSFDEFKNSGHVSVRVRYRLDNLMPLLMAEGRAERLRATHIAFAPMATANGAPAATADGVVIVVPAAFTPTIAPKIFNSSGQLVYSAGSLTAETLAARGAVQYSDSAARARQLLQEQGVAKPLEVHARVRGASDLVLADADSARLLAADTQAHFLEKSRVVIVVAGE